MEIFRPSTPDQAHQTMGGRGCAFAGTGDLHTGMEGEAVRFSQTVYGA